jgi:uncharacterized membrane protein YphA (DoxX/SURF4 family)/DNA-binding transcriptional ArsR family regulator
VLTILIWLAWELLLCDILCSSADLRIAQELGRFVHDQTEGWKFTRPLKSHNISLDVESASPHILVVGGSQTGKSSTIKTILLALLGEPPANPSFIGRNLVAIILILGFIALCMAFVSPLFVVPFMTLVYNYQSGHLTQMGVYAAFAAYFIVVIAITLALVELVRFLSRRKPVKESANVILDYHGEYNFLATKGFKVIDAREYDPLAPNYQGEKYEYIVSDFVDAFLVAYETIGDVQLAILKKKLEEYHDVNAALSSIGTDAKRARSYVEKDRLTGLHLRLEKIVRYRGSKALTQLTKDKQNVIFDLSGIRDRDVADFYGENILSRYMAHLAGSQNMINIVIDEAHRLNTKPLSERGREPTTMRIAREAGKFGGRLIVASQNLYDFPPGFSANFGNIICFRTPSGMELHTLEQMTGIDRGMLQSTMNSLHKGEALLIGPQSHYAVIMLVPGVFPMPLPKANIGAAGAAQEPPEKAPPEPSVGPDLHVSRPEEILEVLKGTALTGSEIARRLNYPRQSVFRHLNTLEKEKKIIRYEDTETPKGVEIFFELNDPNRNESCFHKVLVAKAQEELGNAKVLGGPNNPDLLFNNLAVEVETGTKPSLDGFVEQVRKRFGQGYSKVIVVVINQRQKARYEKALAGVKNVAVLKLTELAKTAAII